MSTKKTCTISIIHFILCFIILFQKNGYCQSQEDKEKYDIFITKQSQYLKLETVIGNNKYDDKRFLLTRNNASDMYSKAITQNGDFCISDEYSIKVYAPNGIGKVIMGERGKGPGEFNQLPAFFISPTGFIAANPNYMIGGLQKDISVFDPSYTFISQKRHYLNDLLERALNDRDYSTIVNNNNGTLNPGFERFYAFNEYEFMWLIPYNLDRINKGIYYVLREDIRNNKALIEFRGEYTGRYPTLPSSHQGMYFYDILCEDTVLFVNPKDTYFLSDKFGTFTISLYSIKNKDIRKFSVPFVPKKYTDDAVRILFENFKNIDKKAAEKSIKESPYILPSIAIKFDNKY